MYNKLREIKSFFSYASTLLYDTITGGPMDCSTLIFTDLNPDADEDESLRILAQGLARSNQRSIADEVNLNEPKRAG